MNKVKFKAINDPNLIRWNLIKARTEKEMRQCDLAKLVGASQKSVSNWEKGIHSPRTHQAIKLVEILGKDITYLLSAKKERF